MNLNLKSKMICFTQVRLVWFKFEQLDSDSTSSTKIRPVQQKFGQLNSGSTSSIKIRSVQPKFGQFNSDSASSIQIRPTQLLLYSDLPNPFNFSIFFITSISWFTNRHKNSPQKTYEETSIKKPEVNTPRCN